MRFLPFVFVLLLGCPDAAEPCEACSGSCTIESLDIEGGAHTEEAIDWGTSPPVGGPHDPCWGDWGVYADPLEPRHWVHNLEHGGVVLLHDCTDCDDEIAVLTAFEAAAPAGRVIVTPYADLGTRFAAISWGWRMQMDCAEQEGLQGFFDAHVDQAPESVTSGAPAECTE